MTEFTDMCRNIASRISICTLQALLGLMTTGCYNSNEVPSGGGNIETACRESKEVPSGGENIEDINIKLREAVDACEVLLRYEKKVKNVLENLEAGDLSSKRQVEKCIEGLEKSRKRFEKKVEEIKILLTSPEELRRLKVKDPEYAEKIKKVIRERICKVDTLAKISKDLKGKKKALEKEDEKSDSTPKQGNISPSGSESAQEGAEEEKPEIALQNQAPDATNSGHTSSTPGSTNLSSNPGRKNQIPNIQIPEPSDSEGAPRDPSPTGVTDLRLASQPSSLDGKY